MMHSVVAKVISRSEETTQKNARKHVVPVSRREKVIMPKVPWELPARRLMWIVKHVTVLSMNPANAVQIRSASPVQQQKNAIRQNVQALKKNNVQSFAKERPERLGRFSGIGAHSCGSQLEGIKNKR